MHLHLLLLLLPDFGSPLQCGLEHRSGLFLSVYSVLHLVYHLSLNDFHGGDAPGLLLHALLLSLKFLNVVHLAVFEARVPYFSQLILCFSFLVTNLSCTILILLHKRSYKIFLSKIRLN